jgi:hypothetical protein
MRPLLAFGRRGHGEAVEEHACLHVGANGANGVWGPMVDQEGADELLVSRQRNGIELVDPAEFLSVASLRAGRPHGRLRRQSCARTGRLG